MLLEPEQVVICLGIISFICLFWTTVNLVTAFPHTETVRPYAELIGNPAPVIVA